MRAYDARGLADTAAFPFRIQNTTRPPAPHRHASHRGRDRLRHSQGDGQRDGNRVRPGPQRAHPRGQLR